MRFADSRRPDEQNVLPIPQVIARGQFENLFAPDGGIKLPVNVFQ
jgi:hypothetical protein